MANEKENQKNETLSWRAAEHHFVEKNLFWHLFIAFVALILVIFALIQRNFFFAFFIVIATVVLMSFGRRRPPIADFEISDEGIAINNSIRYDYEQLESFAIVNRLGRLDEIIIRKKSTLNPFLKLPIDNETIIKAEKILGSKLTKFEHEPSLTEAVSEWLGF